MSFYDYFTPDQNILDAGQKAKVSTVIFGLIQNHLQQSKII